jgi:hypothetical protein
MLCICDVKKGNTSFLKKIPSGAEASNVLVGEVDCLEKPVSAFIRLAQPVVLGDLTEVPVPTRFVFILLGPVVSDPFTLLHRLFPNNFSFFIGWASQLP